MAGLTVETVTLLQEIFSVEGVPEIATLGQKIGELAFNSDHKWFELDPGVALEVLSDTEKGWFTDSSLVDELTHLVEDVDKVKDNLASEPTELTALITRLTRLVDQELGLQNPHARDDQANGISGTDYYRYDASSGKYLYAATGYAPADQWLSHEERVNAARSQETATGRTNTKELERGFINTHYAVHGLRGTRYYRLSDDEQTYLYNDDEFGREDAGWQPYSYWQEQADPPAGAGTRTSAARTGGTGSGQEEPPGSSDGRTVGQERFLALGEDGIKTAIEDPLFLQWMKHQKEDSKLKNQWAGWIKEGVAMVKQEGGADISEPDSQIEKMLFLVAYLDG